MGGVSLGVGSEARWGMQSEKRKLVTNAGPVSKAEALWVVTS